MAKDKMSPKESYDSGYYEPFAGYSNSNKDQKAYWNMISGEKGKVPTQFMEVQIPMANSVGKKGDPDDSYGWKK